MNQGNDVTGPFMSPEPSPARGSTPARGSLRAVRPESQRTTIYPVRTGDVALNQFANSVVQAIQAQTDRMVSELRRVLSRSVAPDGRARIEASDLPDELRPAARAHGMIEQAERQAIEAALLATNGDKREAADRLGISLATLYRRIKAMRIEI